MNIILSLKIQTYYSDHECYIAISFWVIFGVTQMWEFEVLFLFFNFTIFDEYNLTKL